MITSLTYTHAGLLAMPDDGKRREISEGELYVTPPPVTIHQRTVGNIAYAFWKFLEIHPLGVLLVAPMDVILEYWIVDPKTATVEVYRLAAGGFQLTKTCERGESLDSPLLPGFVLPVQSISLA